MPQLLRNINGLSKPSGAMPEQRAHRAVLERGELKRLLEKEFAGRHRGTRRTGRGGGSRREEKRAIFPLRC